MSICYILTGRQIGLKILTELHWKQREREQMNN